MSPSRSFQSLLLLFPPGGPPGGPFGGPPGGPRLPPPGGPPPPPGRLPVPKVRARGQKSSRGSPPPYPYRFCPYRFRTSSAMAADGLIRLSSYTGPPPLMRASTVCCVIMAVAVSVVVILAPISVDRSSSILASPIGWSSASSVSSCTIVRQLGPASCSSLVSSTVGTPSIWRWSSSCRIGLALVPNPSNSGFSILFEIFVWNCRALPYQPVQYQLSLMYST